MYLCVRACVRVCVCMITRSFSTFIASVCLQCKRYHSIDLAILGRLLADPGKPVTVVCVWRLGVDGGADIKRSLLVGIYKRISKEQLQPHSDHTSKLIAVDNTVAGVKPVLIYLLLVTASTIHFNDESSLKIVIYKHLLLVIFRNCYNSCYFHFHCSVVRNVFC